MSYLMFSRVSVEPATEPVTVAEFKAQLNMSTSYTAEDTFLGACITAARQWVELRIGQSIISQTRVQTLDRFPSSDCVELLYGPVTAVTSITYYDSTNTQQTFSSDSYWTDLRRVVPRVVVKVNWPTISDKPGGIDITYTAGMSTVPESIKQAIKLLATHFYQNRVPEVQGASIGRLEFAVEGLLSPYVVIQNAVIC